MLEERHPMPNFDAEIDLLPRESPALPRVLLVDDDESVLETLIQVLSLNGFKVSSATNVNQALALISSQEFDALVSDLHMPRPGDGLTVVSAMRHANPSAVTLICSAFPEMQQATTAILQQADEILVKPMRPDKLVQVILDRLKQGIATAAVPVESVADILDRSVQSTIEEWLQLVRDESEVISVVLEDDTRSAHLPQLFREVIFRLRNPIALGTRAPVSPAAAEHGQTRRKQGYTAAMLVEESRMLQVSIFQTLQDNMQKIDFSVVLVGVMAIADEVDSQLSQQMASYIAEAAVDPQPLEGWVSPERLHRQVA
jgi:DNA-binding response OmpR family regulator